MLQRAFIHLSLILLFAFTQMGVVTHEVSHLTENKQQHQQDQSSHESQCEQCLSHSQVADADLAPNFTFQIAATSHTLLISKSANVASTATLSYSARAPPHASKS